ncbi:hypothetical protein TcYC6_0077660 [Trypanosoma cruzi]|nr:hypothetical protein TcYC6_0077660 [Trypanosoma cruzi]
MPSLPGADVGRSCCRSNRNSQTVTAGTLYCCRYTVLTARASAETTLVEHAALNNAASSRAVDKAHRPSQSSVLDEGWSRNGLAVVFPNAIVSHCPFSALGHDRGRAEASGLEWSEYLSACPKKPASARLPVMQSHADQIWASVTLGKQMDMGRRGREHSLMLGSMIANIRSPFRGTSGITLC